MMGGSHRRRRSRVLLGGVIVAVALVFVAPVTTQAAQDQETPEATFIEPVAFDTSASLRSLVADTEVLRPTSRQHPRGAAVDGNLQVTTVSGAIEAPAAAASPLLVETATIGTPIVNFEGISNFDNAALFGAMVNPPDPVGDVGPDHYVEMTNLSFAVYDKVGNVLLGPAPIGRLWTKFPVPDCRELSGDPIVLYDQLADRWILTQFTTGGFDGVSPFYNCVAISKTGDPTGQYYRYAFITQPDPDGGFFFPDYPKYGVWTDTYVLTTRDFGTVDGYGISVYALDKEAMLAGDPSAPAIQFFLDSEVVPINLIGDGLLPADIDGSTLPDAGSAIPIVGTQDDGAAYGATMDAVNIWDLTATWSPAPSASLDFAAQLRVRRFDSIYPCAPTSRDCLEQPGITDPGQYLDILSYRQRPTWRLAYRNFGTHEAMVTNQAVQTPGPIAGTRWYEIRRTNGVYSVYQHGTYTPGDGVHRWMGSIAMDKFGNMALGYSVVNGTDVFPGIRYTGRLAGDPLGQMTLGEATVIDGTGVQTTFNSRWGDYTSMNIDPVDDCTFWYVNEYYTLEGQLAAPNGNGWQTRIASFQIPGC